MKIADVLRNVRVVALDTTPLIYFVESNPVYIERMRTIVRVIRTLSAQIVTTTLTLTEILAKPLQSGDIDLVQNYRNVLLATRRVSLIPADENIALRAAQLRAKYNLRTPDAIQIATAVEAKADAFLTNDLQLKRVKDLSILILDELEI